MSLRFSARLLALRIICPAQAFAADIILSIDGPQSLADADEYFTDVWGDSKSFDSECDLGWDGFYYDPETVQAGRWQGFNPSFPGADFWNCSNTIDWKLFLHFMKTAVT